MYIKAPWITPVSDDVQQQSVGLNFQKLSQHCCDVRVSIFSATIARKNWLSNRADRRGALKLLLFRVVSTMVAWLCSAHYVPDGRMLNFGSYNLAMALLSGFILWQLYLAMEPTLRARWPQSIVTWNRALSGRWRTRKSDPTC